jgi:ferredoxin-NADP reductase
MAEYQITLIDRQRIARDTMAFWFDTNGARYEFRAGQHADFVFGSGSDNSRTFSLASYPVDKEPIMVAMRMRKTGFKTALNAAEFGTKFKVSRPRGSFTLHEDVTRPAVFLAGGIGITPVRSILPLGRSGTSATQTVFVLFQQGSGRCPVHRRTSRHGCAES